MKPDLHNTLDTAKSKSPSGILLASLALVIGFAPARAGVVENLQSLRNRCLYYAAGHAPNDTNTLTLRHGLYAQSPFSPTTEVDLAASAFSLAALPAAVASGIIASNKAYSIAADAALQTRRMVERSAAASKIEEIQIYGYGGILCHYPVWDPATSEFHAQPGVEFSSIDTTLLLYGLMVSANYFGGAVRADFEAARNTIRWREWLDNFTPAHRNQIRMAYRPGPGFFAWWDWYSQESMLIGLFAAMSDDQIDATKVWRGWRRYMQTYVSPPPDSKTFRCYTTFFGDPFTVLYGLAFLDLEQLPPDIDGINWFNQGQSAYAASQEFFRKERGYLDSLSAGFSICAPNGFISRPNWKNQEPVQRSDATVYTLAGGLAYETSHPESNKLAVVLSSLIENTTNFFGWHGWPVPSVVATNVTHEVACDRIVGQDIVFTGLAIDNFLTHRAQNLILADPAMRRVINTIFPPQIARKPASHSTTPPRSNLAP